MTAEEWKHLWPKGHLMPEIIRPQLPGAARTFVQTHGLPRVMIFEAVGDNASIDFEWSFQPLKSELKSYNQLIRWGDFYDSEKDKLWSDQLQIGKEDFCNGSASICVHQVDGYITRIDCELPKPLDVGLFMNSSLPQFCECMLAATRWSAICRQLEKGKRRESYLDLLKAMKDIDPAVSGAAHGLLAYWPRMFDAFDENEQVESFEITSDPACSKPRFL